MRFDSSSRPRLRVRDVWPRPGLAVVRVTGKIDLMSVPVLAAHLHALASEHKPQRVILDLAEVTIREAHAITLRSANHPTMWTPRSGRCWPTGPRPTLGLAPVQDGARW